MPPPGTDGTPTGCISSFAPPWDPICTAGMCTSHPCITLREIKGPVRGVDRRVSPVGWCGPPGRATLGPGQLTSLLTGWPCMHALALVSHLPWVGRLVHKPPFPGPHPFPSLSPSGHSLSASFHEQIRSFTPYKGIIFRDRISRKPSPLFYPISTRDTVIPFGLPCTELCPRFEHISIQPTWTRSVEQRPPQLSFA